MSSLKEKLETIYTNYNTLETTSDPLEIVRTLDNKREIEVFGFLASVFAYGSVKQINSSLKKLLVSLEKSPYEFIKSNAKFNHITIKHRFFSEKDVQLLLIILNKVLREYDSLYNLFISGYSDEQKNVKQSISSFSNYFLSNYQRRFGDLSLGIKFMFPLPEKGSACKRMNLFLRWMIRKDNLDFGLWNTIPTNKLIIPVDTHIAQISRKLKLTKRKNISWKMAEEITEMLKKFDPYDPLRFDYALCHYNMQYKK
ncbi:TIGR02757 family protein [Ignavibacterium sp.]|uniref:TIGR02757 family protein n=1 Tax=Ignavibacterium sp. TaxID=2651167 RepID=UPI00307CF10D